MDFTPRQLINRAIGKETQARTMYEIYAEKVQDNQGKRLLKELAQEELGHKQTLEKIDPERPGSFMTQKISTAEFVEFSQPELTKESTMQEVLRYAIAEEMQAFSFYTSLAEQAADSTLRNLLNKLALEEEKHKEKLERMYDDIYQPEN
jgi:rubrerythrin